MFELSERLQGGLQTMSKLKGNFKRIISMVLSLAMILSVVPMTAFAENGVIYLPQDEISEEILTSGEF